MPRIGYNRPMAIQGAASEHRPIWYEKPFLWLIRLSDALMPKTLSLSGGELRVARSVYTALILLQVAGLVMAGVNFASGTPLLPWVILGIVMIGAGAPELHARTRSLYWTSQSITLLAFVLLAVCAAFNGGLVSSARAWFGAVLLFTAYVQGAKSAAFWLGIMALELCVWAVLTRLGISLPNLESPESRALVAPLDYGISLLLIFLLAKAFHAVFDAYARQLEESKARLAAQSRQLLEAKEKAEAATQAKSAMLAAVSHDIRTPMNGVLGMAQLLQDTPLSEDQRDCLHTLRVSAESLVSLLNDLLDLSKIEAGKLEMFPAPFSPTEVGQEVCSLFRGMASGKGIALEFIPDDGEKGLWAEGDSHRIRQVLSNLVANAVKYTLKGGVTVRVGRRTDGHGRPGLCYQVKDTGVGMDEAMLHRLFRAFEGDVALQSRVGGTGLGLFISRKLAEWMSGGIEVESSQDRGSLFRFWFPTPVVPEPSDFMPDLAREPVGLLPFEPHVLLVEDETLSRQVAIRMLQRLGCRITCAGNGSEALLKFGAEEFDLVVMDCQMPDMDGYEATRHIRQLEVGRGRTPIVALTAEARESDRRKCLDAGMDDHLVKPVRLQALRSVVEYWLRRPEGAPD